MTNVIKFPNAYAHTEPSEAAEMNSRIHEQRHKALEQVLEALEPLATQNDRVTILRAAVEFYSLDVEIVY